MMARKQAKTNGKTGVAGMGQPTIYEEPMGERIALRLPLALLEQLEAIATEHKSPVGRIARLLIEVGLANGGIPCDASKTPGRV